MTKGRSGLIALFLFSMLFTLGSCSKYQKLLKSDDHELKFSKAVEYYESGNYGRAITLLSDVIPIYRGTTRAADVNYYYAMAHYKQGDYIMASHYFRSFVTAFPNSPHAEEFLFLSAYCQYLESPRPSLDQSTTRNAIRELQGFINRYPYSEKVEEANQLIDELRLKLETKRYENAMLYFRINDFTAAIATFENLIKDFPDTEYRETALYYIVLSHFEFASRSIEIRQAERFEKVLTAYRQLERQFPESQYLARAQRMRDAAGNHLQ
jgi:outer membrane protein assembly factor BamD